MGDRNSAQAACLADPYPAYRVLRERPVVWDDTFGFWRVTRYADVDAVLKDRRFAKNPPPGLAAQLPVQQRDRFSRGILNLDPPDHTRLRALMTRAFSARRMEAMRPAVERLVNQLLDAVVDAGEMEVKRRFAHPIPATMISDMLGIPDADRTRFAELSNDVIRFGNDLRFADDTRTEATVAEFDVYLTRLFAAKRRRPGDDLTSALIDARDADGKLDEDELTHNIRLLFIAGHETTVNLICNALVALHRHPGQLALLRAQPQLMPAAVEEFLRFDSSVQQLPRVAAEDVQLGGQTILAGQMVVLMLGSANHDPERYPAPDELDIRREFHRSKSFGGGAHFCLGAQLARIETEIALATLLRRLPEHEIVNLDSLEYPPNPFFRGPETIQARWQARGRPHPAG